MKIFDCTLYYDEDLILETRLNILNKYVDKFIICESTFTHSGKEKKLNFDIKKFSNFKNKIIYLVNDTEPGDLIYSQNKEESLEIMEQNERYIFFEEYKGEIRGSAGVFLQPMISIAVDTRHHDLGDILLINDIKNKKNFLAKSKDFINSIKIDNSYIEKLLS